MGKDKIMFWSHMALFNLFVVAFLGFVLRSKILFPLYSLNYKHLINTHSHFAFAGWVTLALLTLFTSVLLPQPLSRRKWYQWMFWGIELSALGMLFSFPFQGHDVVSISFSTLYILFTYGYSVSFIRDLFASGLKSPHGILAVGALLCLIISSAGPFTLAYILATGSAYNILYRDAIYFYLHFQYNGFFTLAVFALFFGKYYSGRNLLPSPTVKRFSYVLLASIVPSYFLSLLWHPENDLIMVFAGLGMILILFSLFLFFRIGKQFPLTTLHRSVFSRPLWLLVLLSFVIKSVLQVGTIIPDLGNTVFGFRPIIIGFLHLVFLGLVSFFILSEYVESGVLSLHKKTGRTALIAFMVAVVGQETVLLIQGVGLLTGHTSHVYTWLLWIMSILLMVSSLALFLSGRAKRNVTTAPVQAETV